MKESVEFRDGKRQGSAERLVWMLRVMDNSSSLEQIQKRVDTEVRRIHPEIFHVMRKK